MVPRKRLSKKGVVKKTVYTVLWGPITVSKLWFSGLSPWKLGLFSKQGIWRRNSMGIKWELISEHLVKCVTHNRNLVNIFGWMKGQIDGWLIDWLNDMAYDIFDSCNTEQWYKILYYILEIFFISWYHCSEYSFSHSLLGKLSPSWYVTPYSLLKTLWYFPIPTG